MNMNNPFKPLAVVMLLLPGLYQPALADDSGWTKMGAGEGVAVYVRPVPTEQVMGKEIRTVGIVESNVDSLLALIVDYPAASQWRRGLKSIKKVKAVDERHWYIHIVTDLPWPIGDRQALALVTLETDPATQVVTYKFNAVPEVEGVTIEGELMQTFAGAYTLMPQQDGSVELTMQSVFEAPFPVPEWLIKRLVSKLYIEQIMAMREAVQSPKYQQSAVPLNHTGP